MALLHHLQGHDLLPSCSRLPGVGERGPAPVGLPRASEAPQRVRLWRQRRPVLFEQGQLRRQQALMAHQPQQPPATDGVRVLQPTPLGDERPGVAEHLRVVVGQLTGREIGNSRLSVVLPLDGAAPDCIPAPSAAPSVCACAISPSNRLSARAVSTAGQTPGSGQIRVCCRFDNGVVRS